VGTLGHMSEPNWIALAGVVNMRDLGGRTTADGRRVRDGIVLRSDNLGDLTSDSVALLLGEYRLSDVIDLRTNREHAQDAAWPFDGQVNLHKMSLYPDDDPNSPLPPWDGQLALDDPGEPHTHAQHTARHYLGYFSARPDSLVGALRTVATADGATIINCAAGKDRTGTTSALLLRTVGVPEDQVIADYAASTERIAAILDRLGLAATFGSPEHKTQIASQGTPPQVMEYLLGYIEEELGGVANWLDTQGWDGNDQSALELRMLDQE
jgi:protein-tyrosine phosphatase